MDEEVKAHDGDKEEENSEPDLTAMTAAQLKAELKRRGLPTNGNKQQLLARLQAAPPAAANAVEEPQQQEDEEEAVGRQATWVKRDERSRLADLSVIELLTARMAFSGVISRKRAGGIIALVVF